MCLDLLSINTKIHIILKPYKVIKEKTINNRVYFKFEILKTIIKLTNAEDFLFIFRQYRMYNEMGK